MKIKFLFILTFGLFINGFTVAQNAVFPYKSQITSKNFEAAESGILTDLAAAPNDCALNFAAGSLLNLPSF
jgi:hypothetical protein